MIGDDLEVFHLADGCGDPDGEILEGSQRRLPSIKSIGCAPSVGFLAGVGGERTGVISKPLSPRPAIAPAVPYGGGTDPALVPLAPEVHREGQERHPVRPDPVDFLVDQSFL